MFEIVKVILLAIEVVVCFLMVVIILLQKSKSEGLGLAFGSGMGEALFGSRAGNVLTRLTTVFAVVFLANTLALGVVLTKTRMSTSLMDRAAPASAPMAMPQQQPAAGVPQGGVPTASQGGAPTLPGAILDDSATVPAAPAEAPIVVEQEVPAQVPAEPAKAE